MASCRIPPYTNSHQNKKQNQKGLCRPQVMRLVHLNADSRSVAHLPHRPPECLLLFHSVFHICFRLIFYVGLKLLIDCRVHRLVPDLFIHIC